MLNFQPSGKFTGKFPGNFSFPGRSESIGRRELTSKFLPGLADSSSHRAGVRLGMTKFTAEDPSSKDGSSMMRSFKGGDESILSKTKFIVAVGDGSKQGGVGGGLQKGCRR